MIKNKINLKNKYLLFMLFIIFLFIFFFLYRDYKLKETTNIRLNNINKLLNKEKVEEIKKLKNNIKNENIFLKNLDLKTDSSLTKFVSAKVPFNNKKYIPENLVSISTEFIIDWKWWVQKLRKEAKEALNNMAKNYYRDTWKKIIVVSAYRSYLYQKWIKDRWCPDNLCAKAGYSEHQSGLAVDLWAASTNNDWNKSKVFKSRYKWLKDNAYKYWFTNTYQKWIDIDTYDIEPWHWRYVWEKLAKYLLDNNLTIAQFYNKMEQH